MFKKLLKSNKEKDVKSFKSAKIEKLNPKELGNVTGGDDSTIDASSGMATGKRMHQPV